MDILRLMLFVSYAMVGVCVCVHETCAGKVIGSIKMGFDAKILYLVEELGQSVNGFALDSIGQRGNLRCYWENISESIEKSVISADNLIHLNEIARIPIPLIINCMSTQNAI